MINKVAFFILLLIGGGMGSISSCNLHLLEPTSFDGIRIRTDKQSYRPGEAVTVTLKNETHAEIRFNLCFYLFQIFRNGSWEEIKLKPRVCTLELVGLRAGKEYLYNRIRIPDEFEAGTYRIVFTEMFDKNENLIPEKNRTSNTFQVVH